ncbi:hypothetical protein H696_05625 [Fonticula alba]|uniref:DNA-directed RNA polymerase III subunit RPC9 n=1 Tax=Fonticula alba TaxID=691883 RepID=A0A058Z187_FONAL|nr:hypothetical protein H696_05625 [Fonticula alba]KCV67896.1 hypothetical protein H696_05625 [Fonticula alba]|eukprot:XP_009497716.1 hypothetical protein H696_05625 [Fonticula alba]
MEVLELPTAYLSDFEVLQAILQSEQERASREGGGGGKKRQPKNLMQVEADVKAHLHDRPCAHQTEEHIAAFLEAAIHSGLTKSEKLQILNHQPRSLVELHVLLQEAEERFSEEQLGQILAMIHQHLPIQPPSDAEDGDEEEGEYPAEEGDEAAAEGDAMDEDEDATAGQDAHYDGEEYMADATDDIMFDTSKYQNDEDDLADGGDDNE